MKLFKSGKDRLKKIIIIAVMCTSLVGAITGCTSNAATPNNNIGEHASATTAMDKENTQDSSLMMLPETLKEYVSIYKGTLSKSDYNHIAKDYQALVKKQSENKISEEDLQKNMIAIDKKLRSAGIGVPYFSLDDYVSSMKNIAKEDKVYLIKNEKVLLPMQGEEGQASDKEMDEAYEKAINIFKRYGLNYDEICEQIYNQNQMYAIYNVSNDQIRLDNEKKTSPSSINDRRYNIYKNVVSSAKEIIPEKIWSKIKEVEFNTDGIDNVLAHTVPVDEQSKRFRLAMDEMDMLNGKGVLTEQGKETLVHESGHIITMDNTQVKPNVTEDPGTLKPTEVYKANSYLLQFYNKFWADRYKEYEAMKQETGDTVDFYDKYKKEFVSDYAATSLEEDIAESFRIFVYKNKPSGNLRVDQKIKFFYQFDEMVKLREEFRKNLSLN